MNSVKRSIRKRVFVMMSGGVDSSVAAFLLKKSNKYEVIGMFIKGYNIDGCQEKDAGDARRVAEFLKIPFYTIDLENEYKKFVVNYMVEGYKKGITPNPDVMCNKEIKFGMFLKKALELGADYVSTGHYIRLKATPTREAVGTPTDNVGVGHYIRKEETSPKDSFWRGGKGIGKSKSKNSSLLAPRSSLFAAKDKTKDQSYFLWTLTQEQLKHCLFPIGDYLKSEIRIIAKKAKLPTAGKKDSQGICFLGQISIKDFLKQFLKTKKGDILDINGKKVGEHEGSYFYTIGQRHGLNLGRRGKRKPARENTHSGGEEREKKVIREKENLPYYVADKNLKKNIVVVAEGENSPELYKSEVELNDVNFIRPCLMSHDSCLIFVRVRYRQPLFKAKLVKSGTKKLKLIFDRPVKFVASGQSAVFYNVKEEMIGGGVIV